MASRYVYKKPYKSMSKMVIIFTMHKSMYGIFDQIIHHVPKHFNTLKQLLRNLIQDFDFRNEIDTEL